MRPFPNQEALPGLPKKGLHLWANWTKSSLPHDVALGLLRGTSWRLLKHSDNPRRTCNYQEVAMRRGTAIPSSHEQTSTSKHASARSKTSQSDNRCIAQRRSSTVGKQIEASCEEIIWGHPCCMTPAGASSSCRFTTLQPEGSNPILHWQHGALIFQVQRGSI